MSHRLTRRTVAREPRALQVSSGRISTAEFESAEQVISLRWSSEEITGEPPVLGAELAVLSIFQQWLERYLGLPSAEPGQLTQWQFTGRSPWPDSWPNAVGWLLIAMAIVLVLEFYRRDARSVTRSRRIWLVGLRCLSLSLVLLMLSEVSISVERTALPQIVVLLDDSASMGLRDAYRIEGDQQFLSQRLGLTGGSDAERFELARRILTHDDGVWLRRLRQRHRVRIERFSAEAVPVGSGFMDVDSERAVLAELQRLQPLGEITRPAEAVRQVLNRSRGAPPAAIVLLTDGIASSGDADKLSTIVPLAREQLVPLFVIGLGSDQPTRDVQLAEVSADDVAFVGDPIVFAVKVKSSGFSKQSVVVEMRERTGSTALSQRQFTLPADGQTTSVDLLYTPTQPGDREFVVSVTAPPGDTDASNNQQTQTIRVREGKLKVLLADGLPRWEFRELKNTLEREPTIELHTLLQEADLEFALQDDTAKALRGRFPTSLETLSSYDVILLGDVNPAALSVGILENIREFVRAGGGLLLMSGTEQMPLAFRGSPLEVLVPIDIEVARAPVADADLRESFVPRWTPIGVTATALFRHLPREANSGLPVALPPLFWLLEAPRLKAGATVLAEHPHRIGDKQPLPVIVQQRFGAGQVWMHATDEFWRWRSLGSGTAYSKYWVQVIRLLSRKDNLAGSRGVEFTTDRQTYQRGDTIRFRLQVLDKRQWPASGKATVIVERADEPPRTIELSAAVGSNSLLTGELRGLRNGRYHAWVSQPAFGTSPAVADFEITAPQRELSQRRLDQADLMAASRGTQGRYFALHEADRVPDELPAGQPVPLAAAIIVPLWSRWELLVLFAGLLTTEWLCRRAWRLV